jgi:hypothetical protein
MSRTARLRVKLRKRVRRVRKFTRKLARSPKRGYHRARRRNAKAARKLLELIGRQPVRDRALYVAEGLVGVMEQGGNNAGPMVEKIIHANGGSTGEPWCGDFVAYCYRLAGSKAVSRSWAAVRLLRGLLGISATPAPEGGDLVTFTFDHVGMFVKDNGNGTITTIEGNTGASGAVSDSATGGDGVYEKIREKSLVADYLRVTR